MGEEYIRIGKLGKANGVKGALKLHLLEGFEEEMEGQEVLFVNLKGQKIPFFIEKIEWANNTLIQFEDIDVREKAHKLTGGEIYLRISDVSDDFAFQVERKNLTYKSLEGYTIMLEDDSTIGEILEVVQLPQQEMAIVNRNKQDVLIPLVPAFIKKILIKEQTVIMELPEGLL